MRDGILKIFDGDTLVESHYVVLITEPNTRQDRNGNLVWNVVRMKKHEKDVEYPYTDMWMFENDEVIIKFFNPKAERFHPMILFFIPDNVTKVYKTEALPKSEIVVEEPVVEEKVEEPVIEEKVEESVVEEKPKTTKRKKSTTKKTTKKRSTKNG